MTARRPIAWINGRPAEIPVGDAIAADLVPSSSLGTFDGGTATISASGTPGIDGGGAA